MIYTPLQLHRQWTCRCTINSVTYDLERLPTIVRDMDTLVSTATIALSAYPSALAAYDPITIELSIDGGTTYYTAFTGYALPDQAGIIEYAVTCVDELYKLDTVLGADTTLNNVPVATAIGTLLAAAGIDAGKISIGTMPDLVFRANVGTEYAVILSKDEQILTALKKVCDYARYFVYVDGSGIVRTAKYSSIPHDTAVAAFSSSPNLLATEYGFYNARREIGMSDEVIKKFIVNGGGTGANKPYSSWENPFVSGTTRSYTVELCQTISQCAECAFDIGSQESRQKNMINIEMPTDTSLALGNVVSLRCDEIGFTSTRYGRIRSINVAGDAMSLELDTATKIYGVLDWWAHFPLFDPSETTTGDYSKTIRYINSKYVYVAMRRSNDAVMSSADGISWDEGTGIYMNNLDRWGISFGNGIYAFHRISSNDGRLYTSTNLLSWTEVTVSGIYSSFSGVVFDGQNFFCYWEYYGVKVISTGDFVTFSSVTTTAIPSLSTMIYDQTLSLFICVSATSPANMMWSSDGLSWTTASGASGTFYTNTIRRVGTYICLCNHTGVYRSTDGKNYDYVFAFSPIVTGLYGVDICYVRGEYILIRSRGTAYTEIFTSRDCATFTLMENHNFGDVSNLIHSCVQNDTNTRAVFTYRNGVWVTEGIPYLGETL